MIAAPLDLGIDLNVWPWVWLLVGVFFAIIELTLLAGSFVLLPFAISAFIAALLGFYEVAIEIQWAVFIVGGALIWVAMYKYMMKFVGENDTAPGVGANRLVGLTATVTVDIDPNDGDRKGRVKVESEVWSALTHGERRIQVGAKVHIDEVQGTRVIVSESQPAVLPPNATASPPSGPPSAQSSTQSSSQPSTPPPPPPNSQTSPQPRQKSQQSPTTPEAP